MDRFREALETMRRIGKKKREERKEEKGKERG